MFYVDDIIYMSSSNSLVEEFKQSMMHTFEIIDLCLLYYFLGLEIKQGDGSIFVSQKKVCRGPSQKVSHGEYCMKAITPMNINDKLQMNDGIEDSDASKYRSIMGGLIYLSNTRPDISFVVEVISQYMYEPSRHHMGV